MAKYGRLYAFNKDVFRRLLRSVIKVFNKKWEAASHNGLFTSHRFIEPQYLEIISGPSPYSFEFFIETTWRKYSWDKPNSGEDSASPGILGYSSTKIDEPQLALKVRLTVENGDSHIMFENYAERLIALEDFVDAFEEQAHLYQSEFKSLAKGIEHSTLAPKEDSQSRDVDSPEGIKLNDDDKSTGSKDADILSPDKARIPLSTKESTTTAIPLSLTNRQMEVAHLLARGKSQREIAKDLTIASATVESHSKAIREALKEYFELENPMKRGEVQELLQRCNFGSM